MHFSIYTPLMEFNPTLLMIVITLFVLYLILRKNFLKRFATILWREKMR